jgi:PAS domain S-box-containing protein/putative nucleotidyltransferase with HDIG domain
MNIYKNRWKLLFFSVINIMIFLIGNVLNKKIHNYRVYPSDISFSIIFGVVYGFVLTYLIIVYFNQQKETVELDYEVQASLEQLEAFNEELIAQNDELESFATIISDKEKELKEIINLSPMHIFLKDYKGKYLLCNNAHADFLNLDSKEVEGKNQRDMKIFTELTEEFGLTDSRVINENISYDYIEKIMKDDKELYFRIYKIPIELSEDSKEILVIAQDITDLENMKSEIEEKNKMLILDNEELIHLNGETNRLANDFERVIKLITGSLEYQDDEEYLKNVFELSLNFISSADSGVVFKCEDNIATLIESKEVNNKIYNMKILNTIKLNMPVKNEVKVIFSEEGVLVNKIVNSIRVGFYYGNNLVGGMSLDITNNKKIFNDQDIRLFRSISILVNNHYTNKRISEVHNNTQNSIIISLVKMLELFDSYTKGHSEKVAELSKKMAIKMNVEDVMSAYWAGMVHDIGKILVDREILNKSSNLNFKEYEIIKMHSYWGYQVLSKSEELKDIAKYVLHHHERYDGMGYPNGLKGEEIPIISQIISVADSYDTMVSKRAYKKPLSVPEALQELIDNKGLQFSPEVVDVFVNDIIMDKDKILKSDNIN